MTVKTFLFIVKKREREEKRREKKRHLPPRYFEKHLYSVLNSCLGRIFHLSTKRLDLVSTNPFSVHPQFNKRNWKSQTVCGKTEENKEGIETTRDGDKLNILANCHGVLLMLNG